MPPENVSARSSARSSRQARDDRQQRGLAGPVRPEQAEQLALVHLQIHPLQGDKFAVALVQMMQFEQHGGHDYLAGAARPRS
jgi:hypothetical protein